ncbi:siderophore ABC transporter substrate-binding protein [Streptococcus sp. DD13]|uniref:siderophore ABC transporter substrate-binding protein n=1 Tax=Streptococcus sp. DD13 TaxID=1777881 RepID=UPI00079906E0|nr:ABC transporter substrate-binding protein [Streptococcus sp. DD13]KXT77354.1 Iron compound ABC uptake transporter substrate-binding protein PiuA [Streptococcus sp. DD13]
MKKLLKRLSFVGFVGLVGLLLVACSSTKTSESGSNSSATSSDKVSIQTSTGATEVPMNPKKVVVLDYGAADTLRAIGKEDVIVGLPTDSLPSYLKDLAQSDKVTDVGNLKEIDLEKVASLEPDLIILSGRTQSQMEEFSKIAPTIYFETSSTDYWGSVKTNISELAKVFGEEASQKAATGIKEIDTIVSQAQAANKDTKLTTLTVMLNEGNMAGVAADGRFSFIYNSLGFQPTSLKFEKASSGKKGGGNHGSSLSFESVSQVNPDLIFVVDRTLAIGGDDTQNSDILNNSLLQATNAGKNKKIVTLTPDLWYLSGGGLESTKLMFEEVAKYAGN